MMSMLLMLQAMQIDDYTDLFRGLLTGLTIDPLSPGECHDQLLAVVDSTGEVAEVLKEFIDGTNPQASEQLFVDGMALFNILIGLNFDECHFDELIAKIISFDVEAVLQNYINSFARVTAAALSITECSLNYYGCGEDAGLIFKTLIGWGFKAIEV